MSNVDMDCLSCLPLSEKLDVQITTPGLGGEYTFQSPFLICKNPNNRNYEMNSCLLDIEVNAKTSELLCHYL